MGKRIALSNGRRLVDDVIRVATRMPMVSCLSDMDIGELCQLRKKIRPKLSWNVIFMKAYSLLAVDHPELRQAYVPLPWPHLYEHDQNVCFVVFTKDYRGEDRLVFGRFADPEKMSLVALNQKFEFYRRCELEEVKQFRHQVMFARLPMWFRRFVWWATFAAFPKKRMNNMGTFGMTLFGYGNVKGTQALSPATSTLGVDHLPRRGISQFLYTFDHRVLDGKPGVDMVEKLRKVLLGPIADEIRSMIEAPGRESAAKNDDPADLAA